MVGQCGNWRAGASQPSRSAGTIFLYIYLSVAMSLLPYVLRISKYPALMYAVMFYVILNKRKLHSRSPKMLCILLVSVFQPLQLVYSGRIDEH